MRNKNLVCVGKLSFMYMREYEFKPISEFESFLYRRYLEKNISLEVQETNFTIIEPVSFLILKIETKLC